MKRLELEVPDLNDSFSRCVLDGQEYLLRFTWSDTAQRWSFGLYTSQREPIKVGIRIVPNFPLNLQIADSGFPPGIFGAYSKLPAIGRMDFAEGKAVFAYISANQEEAE